MESGDLFAIGEVSVRTGLSVDTLRFYEREGLMIEPVRRGAGGRRLYSEAEIGWLGVCRRLRTSGMPLPAIHRYARLVRQGPGTEAERYTLLRDHEQAVREQVAELQDALTVIEEKVRIYSAAMAEGHAGQLFVNQADDDRLLGRHPDR